MQIAGPTFGSFGFLVSSLLILPVVVLVYLAFVVVAGKDRTEPSEPRGEAVYLHLVVLISLFVGLLASTALVYSLSQLIGTNTGYVSLPLHSVIGTSTVIGMGATGTTGAGFFGGFPPTAVTGVTGLFPAPSGSLHPVGDSAARGAVLGGIILVVAGALLLTHWSRARRYREDAAARHTNPGRVVHAYLNAAMLVAVLILLVSASLATYSLFEIAAPGVAQVSGRVAPVRDLIPLLFFTLGSLLIADRHWRMARRLRGRDAEDASSSLTASALPPTDNPPA